MCDLLYVSNEDDNDVTIVDLDQGEVIDKVVLPGCIGPSGIAHALTAQRIVSSCYSVATLLDPATRRVSGSIKIGGGLDALISAPARGRLYIPAEDTSTLAV